jgi:acetyltransferase-like isoleucine patch superfamily enzyme
LNIGRTFINKYWKELKYQLKYGIPVWFVLFVLNWLPDISIFIRLRGFAVSLFLPNRPKHLTLGRDITLLSINNLVLGDNVYLAKGCWLNAIGGITFEDDVTLAPYVVMSSTNHGFKDGSVKKGGAHPAPIKVGYGTWVASHSVVAAGVTIGKGNLIGANSVVTKDTEDNSVMAGVPAKFIKVRVDNPSNINSKHDLSK